MPTPLKISATVESVIQHTDDVKTFILRPRRQVPKFKPGQFLHLALDSYDPSSHWPESRVFSIANSPTRSQALRITFAAKGKFTRRMFDDVRENRAVWLKLPFGSFTCSADDAHIVMIAGGTGITPFISFLEYAMDNRTDTAIDLWYGVRSEERIIFESVIEECQGKLANFRCGLFIEDPPRRRPASDSFGGMLDLDKILEKTERPKDAVFYLSGPPQMIQAFEKGLGREGIAEENIRVDAWE